MVENTQYLFNSVTRRFLPAAILSVAMLGGALADEPRKDAPWLEFGSNTMLRAPITEAEGLEVIVSDVLVPPNKGLPYHTHPGQEFVYVIEGEAIHREEGKPDRVYKAGDTFVIGTGQVHSPVASDKGVRAIVFRVHPVGEPERTLVK